VVVTTHDHAKSLFYWTLVCCSFAATSVLDSAF
jgi:hypothetical protein